MSIPSQEVTAAAQQQPRPLDWTETKSILHELEDLFLREDDLNDIQDIQKMAREIDLHYSHSIKDFKQLIKRNISCIKTFFLFLTVVYRVLQPNQF